MEVKKVVGGAFGTNCYILQKENDLLIIDFVPEVRQYINDISASSITICLTHIHYDHFQTLGGFQKEQKVQLILSEKAYQQINEPMFNLSGFGMPKPDTVDLKDARKVADNDQFDWKGYQIKILHTPGHSIDSVVYIIDDIKSIFTGDTIFNNGIGRYDLPSSNVNDLFSSIEKVLGYSEENYTLYPGHGPVTNMEAEIEFNRNLNLNRL